ncbi:MAG: TraX family protein [Lachnospiraceae bacterium]|uniref:TraX family protein n=1 Tax=Parablautia sp. Marseille-Q6255 TaxID=3039593 RepID=UPI0024BCC0F1|nr:TraX family protein [Parablautia sp. Marseille-Q6255]
MTDRHKPFGGISGSTLKLIAIITMFIDHLGATVLRTVLGCQSVLEDPILRNTWGNIYNLSRDIGRLAFPIFCFLIVEGFLHTKNVKKYAGRLFLFALISELPFDLALKGSWYYPEKQNVYFTLLIGLLVIAGIARITKNGTKNMFLSLLPLAAGMYLAFWIDTDYSYKGVFLIAVLYLLRYTRLYQCIGGAAAVSWELPAPLAFIPVYLYNGKRGRQMKYFFYWFYPVHLLLLHTIANYLIPVLIPG